MELTTKHYIYIYTGLVIVSLIYLYNYRQNLIKTAANQTKRNQAIEKIQAYTHAAANTARTSKQNSYKEGFETGARMPSDSKSSALGSRCVLDGQSSVVPDMPIIPADEFLIPDLGQKIHSRVNTQTLKRGQDLIINNIVLAFTKDVIAQSGDVFADIQKIIQAATPATEFTQEERLELFFTRLDQLLSGFIHTKLESRLITAFEQSQILTSNESQTRELVIREIKERVFAQLYNESRRLQGEICRSQSELAQKIESSNAAEIRFKLLTAQIQHRQTLQSLVRLTETPETQEAIRAELAKLADTTIQPAMLTDLDTINSRRLGRLGMPLGESKQSAADLASAIEQVPSRDASYKAYLEAAARRESEFKIDPVAALDKMERSTIGFLEQLGTELGMSGNSSAKYSMDQANTTLSAPSTNRFSAGQPNNLGSWMQPKSGNKQKKQTQNREGFATVSDPTTNTSANNTTNTSQNNDLAQQITGWSRYVYDFIKTNFDSEITAHAERLLTDENNMVPLGILLILGSILLYFIDLSS